MRRVEIDHKLWGAALATNALNIVICARWLTFGLWWTDAAVVLFAAGAFLLYDIHRIINNADVRPRKGWLVHADGTRTQVYFVETTRNAFVPVTINGERVYIDQGESMTLDQIRTDQRIVLTYHSE